MMLTRRDVLKTAAVAGVLPFAPALAQTQTARPLRINLLGFALGIHVPAMTAVYDLLPTMGYAPVAQRMDQIRTLTQTLIAGAADSVVIPVLFDAPAQIVVNPGRR